MSGLGERIAFAAGPVPVEVEVRAPEALEAVRALFPTAESDGRAPDVVLDRAGPALRLSSGAQVWSSPDLPEVLTTLELRVSEEAVGRSGHLALHAGGVVLRDGALLLAGPSGSGKSTLTAGLARRRFPVLGDDAVLLAHDGLVHPLRRRIKVEEPARTLLGLPPPAGPLRAVWPHAAFYDPADLGGRWAEPAAVSAVVLPQRLPGGNATLEPIRSAEALHDLLGNVLLRVRVSAEDFTAASDALGRARCFRLRYADCVAAVELLATLA